MPGTRLPTLLILLTLTVGCAGHRHLPVSDTAPVPSSGAPAIPAAFDVTRAAPVLEPVQRESLPEDATGLRRKLSNWLSDWMRGRDLEHYRVEQLHFPAAGNNGQPDNMARLRYYRGDGPTPRPQVLQKAWW